MPRLPGQPWTNFTAGELSPRLEGRIDVGKYFNGLIEAQNLQIHPHGGASKRPGSIFVSPVKDNAKKGRLLPFIFSEEQAYILELFDGGMRLFVDRGVLVGGTGPNLVTNGDFASPSGWTLGPGWSISGGVAVKSAGVASSLSQAVALTPGTEYFVSYRIVTATGSGAITFSINGTADTPREKPGRYYAFLTAGASGGVVFSPVSTFGGSVDDVVVRARGPHEIITPWTEAQLPDIKIAQYADVMYMVHPEVAPQKLSRYDNLYWEFKPVEFTSPPAEWADVNYPGAVGFYEKRLWLAGTPKSPQTLWASVTGDYENFTTGTDDDDALEYTIARGEISRIKWLIPQTALLVGTYGGIFSVGARSTLDPITPTNVSITPELGSSVSSWPATLCESHIIFSGRHGKKIREMSYFTDNNGYKTRDLTLLAEHITGQGISELVWQEDPDSLLLVVRNDGVLLAGTYYPSEEVVGWSRWVFGGDGIVESICTIPNTPNGQDDVYLIVQRSINGQTKRYIEVLSNVDWGENLANAFFVDSGLTYEGSPTTIISGLEHLEGQVVQILVDGATHPDRGVLNGKISLQTAGSKVHVGLGYQAKLVTMRPEMQIREGTIQGRRKRVIAITTRLYRSMAVSVGFVGGKCLAMPFRSTADPMDAPPPLFTGDKTFDLANGWDDDGRVAVCQDLPLPMTVLMVIPWMEVGGVVSK
jgi:hypothetical protein